MATVTLDLPPEVLEKAKYTAQRQGTTLDAVVREYLVSWAQDELTGRHEAMQREEEAFRRMHPTLLREKPAQYVAIHKGSLIDSDLDQAELVARIDQTHPDQIVLIAQVNPEVEEQYRIRIDKVVEIS